MRTVEIPGGTAQIREQRDLSVRQRRMIEVAGIKASGLLRKLPEGVQIEQMQGIDTLELLRMGFDESDLEAFQNLQDITILATLASWTLDRPLPTAETVGDLPGPLYDALSGESSAPGAEVVTGFEVSPDPQSPTNGSAGSVNGSKVGPVSPSATEMTRLEPSGASTASAG